MANSDRGRYKGYTPARQEANKRYDEKTDRLTVRLPKGEKQKLKDHCDELNVSVNSFIVSAISQKMGESGK